MRNEAANSISIEKDSGEHDGGSEAAEVMTVMGRQAVKGGMRRKDRKGE
jgi:hypothetical protein